MAEMTLFGTYRPNVYRLSDIYRYNFRGTAHDNSQTGTIVPSKDSIIVDDTLGQGNIVFYTVTAVDNSGPDPTYEALLQEVSNNMVQTHKVDNFGNSFLVLYYESNGYTEGGNTFTRMIVDRKLIMDSEIADYYVITDLDENIISIDQNDFMSPPGDGHIPLVDPDGNGRKEFKDCGIDPLTHTVHNGDHLLLKVFDSNGTMLTELNLICREAKGIGDLTVPDKVITDFVLLKYNSGTGDYSEVGDGYTYELSVGNDAESLIDNSPPVLKVRLIYGDGSTEDIDIHSNPDCFVYGLDGIKAIPEHVGDTYPFLVKYYLAEGRMSPVYSNICSERFLSVRGKVEIIT